MCALALSLACKTPQTVEGPAETEAPTTEAEGPAATGGTATKSDRRARIDTLEPAQVQLDAGIPYLRFAVELDDAASRGPEDAPVTMVMFSDFECPFCVEAIDLVAQLEKEYEGKLRFVYKAYPIERHPYAMIAALMGFSAMDQGKFWAFHDLLYTGRRLDERVLGEYAQRSGLNMSVIDAELESLRYGAQLRRDLRQGKRLSVRSTPTFFINGRPLIGAQPISAFRHMIDQEIDLAQGWREAGVPADQIYAHATHLGYTRVTYEGAKKLDEDSVYAVPVGASPARGPQGAKITIVAFSDFRCPYCTRGNETLELLRDRYEDELRIVYKYLPFQGPAATSAALGAWAAGKQGKFWEFHDEMYRRGPRFTLQDLELTAMRIGLDIDQWYVDVESEEGKAHIRGDIELAKRLSITGTPTYFVNGRPLDGAHSEFDFRLLLSDELERVDKELAKGTPREKLYEALVGL
jgi:protein-disulfide isomerase